MRTALTALAYLTMCLVASANDPAVPSPDQRYIITLRHPKTDAIYPVIVLRDKRTGRDTEVFNYDSVGQGTTGLDALWSPNSRYVAITIAVGPATQDVEVYRIDNGKAVEVELLPPPKAIDAKKHSFRGGPSAAR